MSLIVYKNGFTGFPRLSNFQTWENGDSHYLGEFFWQIFRRAMETADV